MDKREAGGCSTRHTIPAVPVRRAATPGDREALGGDVSRLWCSKRQRATCTFVPPHRRAGNQHQPLVHATSCFLKLMSVRHQVESGSPFNADRHRRMDIVIEREGP